MKNKKELKTELRRLNNLTIEQQAQEIFDKKLKQPQYAAYINNENAKRILYKDILSSLQFQNYTFELNKLRLGENLK